jgi:hypothetical protein
VSDPSCGTECLEGGEDLCSVFGVTQRRQQAAQERDRLLTRLASTEEHLQRRRIDPVD